MEKNKWYYANVSDNEMFYSPCVVMLDGKHHYVIIIYKNEIEELRFNFDEAGNDRNGYSISNISDITRAFKVIFD